MRNCAHCQNSITACFGFVKAGDILESETKDCPPKIRELCGKCGLKLLFFDTEQIEKLMAQLSH